MFPLGFVLSHVIVGTITLDGCSAECNYDLLCLCLADRTINSDLNSGSKWFNQNKFEF